MGGDVTLATLITASDIESGLREVGVGRSDTVFAHTGLQGALRVEGETPEQKLETVLEGFQRAVPDGVLIMPTFTYSFCEGETFDIVDSPSTVGALSERFRRLPGVRRTSDPIFSSAVRGELADPWQDRLFGFGDTDCFGPESIFAYLLESRAQIVCFGVGFRYCTFVHHVEQRLGVPYRFFKTFRGTIRDGEREIDAEARYFVRKLAPEFSSCFGPLGEVLLEGGSARLWRLARGPAILAVPADEIEPEVERHLASDPDFLIRRGHPEPGERPTRPAGEGAR